MSTTPPRQPGKLFLVPTPLGNTRDITLRALDTLKATRVIAAEDTRVAGALLTTHGIAVADKTLLSCFAHNEGLRTEPLLARLAAGSDVALVSDAGTPAISDPGAAVVAAAVAAGFPVVPLPGPCAAVTAASVAGEQFNADFGGRGVLLLGFLPRGGPERYAALSEVALEHRNR
jgi:16S rRNA (cytidine1402-2'-O)-methyltransferase